MTTPELKEVLDRTRRIETRLTNYLEKQGFETGAVKPMWRAGVIHAPSASCGLKDLLDVIPAEWPRERPVVVTVRGKRYCAILLT